MRDQISGWPKTDIDTVYPGDDLRCLSVVRHMLAPEAPRGLEREQFANIAALTKSVAAPPSGRSINQTFHSTRQQRISAQLPKALPSLCDRDD